MDLASKLPMSFYRECDAVDAARRLLGCVLVTQSDRALTAGIISETEAYMGVTDRASHAFGGRRTRRTETMYMDGGHAYVYLIYGMYSCMNVVVNRSDIPHAVLIRGIIPLLGINIMRERRGSGRSAAIHTADGPGRLCRAMGIDRSYDTEPLDGDRIFISDCGYKPSEILTGRRINIDYAGEDVTNPWRFFLPPDDRLYSLTDMHL